MDMKREGPASPHLAGNPSRRSVLAGASAAAGWPLTSLAAPSAQDDRPVSTRPLHQGVPVPKIIIHAADGTFDPVRRAGLVSELTEFALECEGLPKSPFMKSTVWTYFSTYPAEAVFIGGAHAYAKIISVQMFVIAGGLDEKAKKRLIKGTTEIVGRHSAVQGNVPVYVVLQEIPEINWGFLGETADLEAMRASPLDKPAI